ncbi:MAG: DUF362 domain-containing protein [Chitinispirillaceae bacterium]|nr:DUF362 domain-containing protein [Chitinispirillaceae bacterium]
MTTRREFIGTAAAGAAVLAAQYGYAQEAASGSKSEVFVGKGSAEEVIPKIFKKMGGIERFVKPGSRVMIKPNMSFANPPDWGTGTSPEAVYTMAKLCLDAGAKRVIVCDNTLREPEQCKVKTGIVEALKPLKGVVLFIPKQDSMFIAKSDPRAKSLTSTEIVKQVYETGCLISLPAAKTHSAAGVSFNCKGLMGLIKERGSFHRETDMHTAIPELLYYMKPHICFVDATRALLDNGPAGPGKVIELKTFVGGIDPVAVDSYAVTLAAWYGKTFDGTKVKHLKNAGDLKLGNVEPGMITEIPV